MSGPRYAAVILALCAAPALAAGGSSDLGAIPGPKTFLLAACVVPVPMMDAWKQRGINTLIGVPEGHDALAWSRAADARGINQIRLPLADPAADLSDPRVIAWLTDDEPSNLKGAKLDYGQVTQDPADVIKQAAPWRAAARAAGRSMPVLTNHVGSHLWPDWARGSALMHDYMKGPASDWLSGDSYPVQQRRPLVIRTADGYASTTLGVVIDRQIAWSGGKPVMSFVGVSPFEDDVPAPTVGEFRAMAWSSVIHGAAGVFYFSVRLKPRFEFDATPPQLIRAITEFDRQIAAMNDLLMDGRVGGRRPSTVFRSAPEGLPPTTGQLPYPFEATEVATDHGPVRIILNLADHGATLEAPQWGLAGVVFPAYGVRLADSTGVRELPPGDAPR